MSKEEDVMMGKTMYPPDMRQGADRTNDSMFDLWDGLKPREGEDVVEYSALYDHGKERYVHTLKTTQRTISWVFEENKAIDSTK